MNNNRKLLTPRGMAKIAILSAVAVILMMFDFPLPFAPGFYKLDFSEVAVLLGGFSMGPMAAVAIEGLKIILNVLFTGSGTAYVGEFANFLIGASFTVTASVIYKLNKTRKGAFIGMITGTIIMAVVGCFMNALLLLPMYSVLYQMPMDVLIGMGTALIPAIHDIWTFVLLAVVPFNLVKGFVVSAITAIMYKHVSPILHS